VRILVTAALVVLTVAGCGSESSDQSRVERCTERLLSRGEGEATDEARAYVRRTYCGPFERRGWVYEDGALSIDTQKWLDEGGMEVCETAGAGGQSVTVPCEDESPTINCAMLHHVRRSEVREYVAQLPRDVECDDGTPVEQLGVP
jgi:hypothetical protein